jgi:hypothetical protein
MGRTRQGRGRPEAAAPAPLLLLSLLFGLLLLALPAAKAFLPSSAPLATGKRRSCKTNNQTNMWCVQPDRPNPRKVARVARTYSTDRPIPSVNT